VTQRQLERDLGDWIGERPATYGRLARACNAPHALAAATPISRI
jgi:hypothetical protein